MKRKWQTLLDTPLSREVIDRCGYLVDRANIKSKVWKEVALEWVEKGRELGEDLNENNRLMEGVGGRCDRIQKLHECQLSEREETKELHKESRGLLNKLAACRQVACPMCDAWKAEVDKVNKEKARLEKLVFQKKQVSRFASPCANSSLLYCR